MSTQDAVFTPLQRLVRSKPYLLASCGVAIFTYQGGRDIINVLLPAIQAEFGLSYTAVGLLAASYDAGYALLLVLGGYMSDKYGQSRVILIGLAWFVLVNSAAGLASSDWLLFGLRFASGFAFASYFASGNSLLAEAFPPSQRGRAIGLHYAGGAAGRCIIPVLAGILTVSVSWRLAFLPLSFTAIVTGILFLLFVKPLPASMPVLSPPWETLRRKVLKNKQLLKVCTIKFFVTFTNMPVIFVPLYLVRTWNMAVSEAALYAGITALIGVPGSPLIGELSDRLGWKNVVMTCLALEVVFLAAFPWVAPGPGLLAILVGFGIVNRSIAVVIAVATRASVPSERGMSLALVNTVGLVAITVISVLGGSIADTAGLLMTFIFLSFVALATFLALGLTRLGKLVLTW